MFFSGCRLVECFMAGEREKKIVSFLFYPCHFSRILSTEMALFTERKRKTIAIWVIMHVKIEQMLIQMIKKSYKTADVLLDLIHKHSTFQRCCYQHKLHFDCFWRQRWECWNSPFHRYFHAIFTFTVRIFFQPSNFFPQANHT